MMAQSGHWILPNSNMATIAVYYTKFDASWPSNFMIAIHVFVFKMHIVKIFQNKKGL